MWLFFFEDNWIKSIQNDHWARAYTNKAIITMKLNSQIDKHSFDDKAYDAYGVIIKAS